MPTLHVKNGNSFNKVGYMNGVTILYVYEGARLREFPTEEMVNSKTLHTVYLRRGAIIDKFHVERFKKLKLSTLLIDIDWTRVILSSVVNNISSNTSQIVHLSDISSLKTLIIRGFGLSKASATASFNLLKKISGARNLEWLELTDVSIKKIPEGFFNFPKLIHLNISDNLIDDPNELKNIYKLGNLRKLDLSFNVQLKTLPGSITELKKLQYIWMIGNPGLESLPNNIGNMNALRDIRVSHRKRINIPESILKLNQATVIINNIEGRKQHLGTRNYFNRWKIVPRVPIPYTNQRIPNNGASNSIAFVNFKTGNKAMKIKNSNRSATYMTVNTFNQLSNMNSNQGKGHIYRRGVGVRNIYDVYNLNGNTNVFINPMTTKVVKRRDIEFVKFT